MDGAVSGTGGRLASVSGALLLGGSGAHREAARLAVGGVAPATRIARLLATCFEEVLLVGDAAPQGAPGRHVAEGEGPACALRGLRAALEASGAERVLVVAGDRPLLTPDLLLALVAWPAADVVLPRSGDALQPLCAVYRRDAALPVARRHLDAGRLALDDLVGALDAGVLEPDDLAEVDPSGSALLAADTPAALERVDALLAQAEGEVA